MQRPKTALAVGSLGTKKQFAVAEVGMKQEGGDESWGLDALRSGRCAKKTPGRLPPESCRKP